MGIILKFYPAPHMPFTALPIVGMKSENKEHGRGAA